MTGGVSPWEVWDRAHTGPKVDQKEYDFKILPELAEKLVKEHGIKIDRASIVPEDNSLADSIYQAGYELLLENGLYCPDTHRMIKVSENEIKDAIRNTPSEITIGSGNEAVRVTPRRVGDPRRPIIASGCGATPCSEEMYVKATQSYAQEPFVQLMTTATLRSVEGHEVVAHSPYEIRAAILEGKMTRMACALAGRPGIALVVPMTPITPEARIAAENGDLKPSDLHMISIVGELKLGMDSITVLSHWLNKRVLICPESLPIFGGYLGGSIEKMAILDVAAHLASCTMLSASLHYDGPVHVRWGCTTTRETMQVAAHTGMAIDRNTNLLTAVLTYARAGTGTDMAIIEAAAEAIANTVSGREVADGFQGDLGVALDHVDGLQGRAMGKICSAATKLDPADANRAINKLLSMYDKKDYYKSPLVGKSFQECYNTTTVKPTQEHLRINESAMQTLEEETGLTLL
jgi:methylamine--corrinoid protein Co-methyltransferase